MTENVHIINTMLEQVSLNFISNVSDPQQITEKRYKETLDRLIMIFCLITHTILNNAGNDRSIHYDSPTDLQTDTQGKILATCIRLIEFDTTYAYNNVFFIYLFL